MKEVKRSLMGMGLMLSVLLRVAAVLLAVRYVGLSYDLAEGYIDLLWLVQWIMPNLLWCVLWFFVLPVLDDRLIDWLGEDQDDGVISVSEASTPGERLPGG
jgi:hypothetical protein